MILTYTNKGKITIYEIKIVKLSEKNLQHKHDSIIRNQLKVQENLSFTIQYLTIIEVGKCPISSLIMF